MILFFPLALITALVMILRVRARGHPDARDGRGWRWFLAWLAVGAVTTFSFLTGFSIGLLFLPVVVIGLLWVTRRSPYGPEWRGFVGGVGVTLLVVAFIQRDGDGLDPRPWLAAGLVLLLGALAAYARAEPSQ
ncbi:MAG TPA: hypothetical protein VFU26_06760 [Gaiellaceae bacterium]|nr:hypothetical protein [Gaiellaceae bacterium]